MSADEIPAADSGQDPAGEFCVQQRGQWLARSFTFTRNWHDAQDAASELAVKVLSYHDEHGMLCPPGHDPTAWWMASLDNLLIDEYRKSKTRHKHARGSVLPDADIADQVTDEVIASQARAFVDSLSEPDHLIAVLRWVVGMKPKEIAERLGMKDSSVRRRLSEIAGRMRTEIGVTQPRKVLREKTT